MQHGESVRLNSHLAPRGTAQGRPAQPTHFAPAHRAHTLDQLSRLQLEGPAALHLLVPQLHSTSFFGPKKDQEALSMSGLVLRLACDTLAPCPIIKVTAAGAQQDRPSRVASFLAPLMGVYNLLDWQVS